MINLKEEILENQKDVNVCALFDHEEIGSKSVAGADSEYLKSVLSRVYKILADKDFEADSLESVFRRSFLVSADMVHGVHPNYSSYHQSNHKPHMNKGIGVKTNCNQRYITSGLSGSIFKLMMENASVPTQDFIVKQDMPCGSTIGPMLSSHLGCLGVDVGVGQLAMHSIREMMGVLDTYYYCRMFETFYENDLPEVRHKL